LAGCHDFCCYEDIEIYEELNKASELIENEEFLAAVEKSVDLSIQF